MRIELTPTLTHCIETAARDEYFDRLNEYIEAPREDPKLKEKIQLLWLFLESADFTQLRAESEKHLTAGKRVKFTLYLEAGKPTWEMSVDQ